MALYKGTFSHFTQGIMINYLDSSPMQSHLFFPLELFQ